jgi:imidazolonepropionase-like amidohydrolase
MTARLAVRAPRAFDGERSLAGGATVLVDDGRIIGVEAATAPLPDRWPVADFPDSTVLPGLIDTHVHLCGDGGPGALERLPAFDDDHLATVIDDALRRHLAAGVTTVRDLGDRRWAVLRRRDAGTAGLPTVLASGPPITSVRGHCWHMGGEVAGPDQLREAVRERAERGVDVVKVMAAGGGTTAGTDILRCQFTAEELRLVVDEVHAAGLPVTAHTHALAGVELALVAGVDGIEHGTCLTESGFLAPDDVVEALARRRIAVCPTLGALPGLPPPPPLVALLARAGMTPEQGRQGRIRLVAELYRGGVTLVSGTDAGIGPPKPHGVLPRAVAALLESDVPGADALASATKVAAQACGIADRKGRLHPGLDADLLVVHGDPLTDIGALERVAAVMIGGGWAGGELMAAEPRS